MCNNGVSSSSLNSRCDGSGGGVSSSSQMSRFVVVGSDVTGDSLSR